VRRVSTTQKMQASAMQHTASTLLHRRRGKEQVGEERVRKEVGCGNGAGAAAPGSGVDSLPL
jgi:hypothetical protein